MIRKLTPRSTLEGLKREAKRWLKALHSNVEEAHARLKTAFPDAPDLPMLRHVQHALAREHGLPGWTALKKQLSGPRSMEKTGADLVNWFLENACPDHHVRGGPNHVRARHTAMRILQRHPEAATANFYTAVVCGDLGYVQRALAERPELATRKIGMATSDRSGAGGSDDLLVDIGPKGWEPLLYLTFTRLPLESVDDNALAIARLLLDNGADPNAFFMAGDSRYTPLVGAIGEGEEDRPAHSQRDALVRLLLERGAEPYDIQVVYNIGFHGQVLWFLKLIHERSVRMGRQKDWDDPEWSMLDMGGYGCGARWHLDVALKKNDLELAEWILTHGGSPNVAPARDKRFSQVSLYDVALRNGLTEMAELLLRFGAKSSGRPLEDEEAFVAAAFRRDRAAASALLAKHPEYLASHVALREAANRDEPSVIEFLIDLGVSPNVRSKSNETALHAAAYANSARAAAVLIERGAEIDPVDSTHDGTPLWWAVWGQRPLTTELLSRFSHDVWALAFTGNVERLRELLEAEPRLATLVGPESTPLMWLPPNDEARAMEVAKLFVEHGADPSIERHGTTAADRAERLGLYEAAAFLRSR